MAYNREIWQDHVTEFSDRFREVVNGDGTISHIPVEGEVIQQGTPQNARHFNAFEEIAFANNVQAAEAARVLLLHQRTLNGLSSESGNYPDKFAEIPVQQFGKNRCAESDNGHHRIYR